MTRTSRMLLVVGVTAVVAVVVLAMIARQYSRVATPMKSVEDLAPATATAPSSVERPPATAPGVEEADPGPDTPGPEPAGTPASSVLPVDPAPDEASPAPAAAVLDEDTRARLDAFVAGRRAVLEWIERRPKASAGLIDEAEGYREGRDSINMHNFKLFELRVARAKAIEAAGGTEEDYRAIREQYRAWRGGDGTVDPEWARRFEAAGDLLDDADLGRYEPLDF